MKFLLLCKRSLTLSSLPTSLQVFKSLLVKQNSSVIPEHAEVEVWQDGTQSDGID